MTRISNVRKTTKFKRSIKAISPVIATLLMIAIAVVASLVVYAWVTGYIGGTTSTAGKAIQIQSFASQGSLADPKTGPLVVYVQNVGQAAVNLKQDGSVYVNGDLKNILHSPASSPLLTTGQLILVDQGQTVELVIDYSYTAGTHVGIKIVTTDGTFMTTTGTGSSSSGGSGNPTQYSIVVTQSAHGAIAPAGTTSYAAGSTPSFTITPDVGYHIASVTTNAGAQALTSPYVFPALSADSTLTATFAADTVQHQVTFALGNLGAGATGTILTVGTTTYTTLPQTVWVNDGTIYSYTGTVPAGTGKQYVLTGTAGLASPIVAAGTATPTYKTQCYLTVTSPVSSPTGQGWYDAGVTATSTATAFTQTISNPSDIAYSPAGYTGTGSAPTSSSGSTVSFTINAPSTLTWKWTGVMTLYPNGATSTTGLDITSSTYTNNWQCVSDTTAADGTNYVYRSSSSSETDYYTLPSSGITSGTISSVSVGITAQRAGSNNAYATTLLRIGTGSDLTGTTPTKTLTTSWADYSTAYSRSWTWTEINTLQAGITLVRDSGGSGTREARCTLTWVSVNFSI